MAQWVAYENSKATVTVLYRNVVNGQVSLCGEVRRDTPANMVVDWVVKDGNAQPGDIIKLPGGVVLQMSLTHAHA